MVKYAEGSGEIVLDHIPPHLKEKNTDFGPSS